HGTRARYPEELARVGRPRHLRRDGARGRGDLPRPAVRDDVGELANGCCQGARAPERGARRSRAGRGMSRGRTQHMADRRIGTREEWLAAREQLLVREKEHTRLGDELARQRRELPWVAVEKEYRFETEAGEKSLVELFDGRSQLLVYHFMFGPT